jgi:UDPglucose--hexose-1-phosphate uridylyltransferase
MIEQAATYRRSRGRNLFDDLLAAERADGRRIVMENDDWVAFVPFAARWPYELHLYPRVRAPDLPALGVGQRDSLADIYLYAMGRFGRLFDRPAPYVAAWHQAPDAPGAQELALHLELFSNRRSDTALKFLAGTEAGMDMFSNDVIPEEAARRLRDAANSQGPGRRLF